MRTIACFSLALLAVTACDTASELPFGETPAAEVHTIAYLKSRCVKDYTPVTEDITVRGIVTGNDLYGEFYKTLVVEDASGGITVAVDRTALADDFPTGAAVEIHCNGLTLADYGGKVTLGTEPGGEAWPGTGAASGAGRIPAEELGRHLRRTPERDERPAPAVLTFDQVRPQHIDTYVRFEDVRFAESGNWCDIDPETSRPVATERLLRDAAGRTFIVRTAATCTYAKEPVPQGTGSISGIIDCFNGKYTLRVSDRRFALVSDAAPPTAYPSAARY